MTRLEQVRRAAPAITAACLGLTLLGCTEELVFRCTPGEVTIEADTQDGRTLVGLTAASCDYLFSPAYGGWSSDGRASAALLAVHVVGSYADDYATWLSVVAVGLGLDGSLGGSFELKGDVGRAYERAGTQWLLRPSALELEAGEAKLTLIETRGEEPSRRDAIDTGTISALAPEGWPAAAADRREAQLDLQTVALPGGGWLTVNGSFQISVDAAVGGGGGGGGGGDVTYGGVGAGECRFMLDQLGWDCPATPPVFAASNCIRDIDVAEAALFCWAAECHTREGDGAQASEKGQFAVDALARADQLCDDISFEGGAPDCNTLHLHPCP